MGSLRWAEKSSASIGEGHAMGTREGEMVDVVKSLKSLPGDVTYKDNIYQVIKIRDEMMIRG